MSTIYHVNISWGDEGCHSQELIASSLDKVKAEQYAEDLRQGHIDLPEHILFDPNDANVSIYVEEGSLI